MTTDTSILSLETWICPIQYGIHAEANPEIVTASEAAAAEAEGEQTEQSAEGGETASEAAATEEEKPAKKAWYTERIDKLTAQKHELETRNQTLAQQNANLQAFMQQMLASGMSPAQATAATEAAREGMQEAGNAGTGKPATGDPRGRLFTDAEIRELVQQEAVKIAQQQQASTVDQQFNQKCNDVSAQGNAKFKDFQTVVGQLNSAGVMDRPFLEAVIEFQEAPEILHHLGQEANIREGMRIKDLSPVAMGRELQKLANSITAQQAQAGGARPASNAPPPVTRVAGNASPPPSTLEALAEAKNDEAWFAMREKQLAEKRMH